MQELFDINPHDVELVRLSYIYLQNLDFADRKIKYFVKKSLNLSFKYLGKNSEDLNTDIFNKNSCVIYSSLLP